MKKVRLRALAIAIVTLLGMAACADYPSPKDTAREDAASRSEGQIFVIDYTKIHGSVTGMFYRSDGNEWEGEPTASM